MTHCSYLYYGVVPCPCPSAFEIETNGILTSDRIGACGVHLAEMIGPFVHVSPIPRGVGGGIGLLQRKKVDIPITTVDGYLDAVALHHRYHLLWTAMDACSDLIKNSGVRDGSTHDPISATRKLLGDVFQAISDYQHLNPDAAKEIP